MIILGIETSCDETAAAVLEQNPSTPVGRSGQLGRIQILSNIVASSSSLQSKYGGIIPEQAAREQIKSIIPVIEEALRLASLAQGSSVELDAIAVTCGPGLIGSLLVGVETAKVLAKTWDKPLIPVNHLIGHFYANWISVERSNIDYRISEKQPDTRLTISEACDLTVLTDKPTFPCLGLLVSGGHTDLVLFKAHGRYKYLGGTRDDAAGECFDKCARLLGLPYPGGPEISKHAKGGNPKAFHLPRPMSGSKDFDFSFSGLKTAVNNLLVVRGDGERGAPLSARSEARTSNGAASRQDPEQLSNLCASIEEAIIDTIVKKTIAAAKIYNVEQIIVAGGVAANLKLGERLTTAAQTLLPRSARVFIPPPYLCTDNGAMIAAASFFERPTKYPLNVQADPNLSLSQ